MMMSKNLLEKIRRLPPRLLIGLGCHLALVAVGLYILLPARSREERFLLGIFLAVFAVLALKTVVHANKNK
ncbi:MAG: hypothetical protein JW793_03280 [Acidobacteria bacterium]|nr:hypothetical protein [Acidobacteriota bacterium]